MCFIISISQVMQTGRGTCSTEWSTTNQIPGLFSPPKRERWQSTANQTPGFSFSSELDILTAMVGGGGALRAAILLTVGGGEVGLRGAAAEAHLGAACRHLGHALLGLQGLGPEGRVREGE